MHSFFSLLLSSISLVATEPTAGLQPSSEVFLRGAISEDSAERVIAEILATPGATLVVTSAGGVEDSAIRLGEAIRDSRTKVVARGYCLSACAYYILPASPEPVIEPDTLVGFHTNTPGMVDLIEAAAPGSPLLLRASATQFRAVALYQSLGIDTRLFNDAIAMSGIECFRFERRSGEVVGATGDLRARVWMPTRAYLSLIGMKFADEWPASQSDAQVLINRRMRAGIVWRYGAPGQQDHLPGSVPECPSA